MAETGTFSALVDEVILRSGRRDRLSDVIAYVRTTIRECTVLALFDQDLVETQIAVTAVPVMWTRPLNMRQLLVAKPDGKYDRQGKPAIFKERPPNKDNTSDLYHFYLSGNTYIFSGCSVGDTINLAYFSYAPKFHYYADAATRPAKFDDELQTWEYLDAYDDSEALMEQAENLVTNWLVFYWYDIILEGSLAKIYKTVGDERAKSSYALYKSQQADLLAGESRTYLIG